MYELDEVVIIDISHWQGRMKWEVAKPLIDAAYIKSSDGLTWIDPEYKRNMAEVQRLEIPWGAYHFMRGDKNGRSQAQHFVKQIAHFDKVSGKWIIECPLLPALDVEHRGLATRETLLKNVVDFCKEFRILTGVDIMIYTSTGFWNGNMPKNTGMGKYRLWIAQYNAYLKEPVLPNDWNTWVMWQWSADGNLRGPEFGATGSKSIDINRYRGGLVAFYRDYPGLASKPVEKPQEPVEPPVEEPVEDDDDMKNKTIAVYTTQTALNVRNEIIPSRKYGGVAGRSYKASSVLMTLPPGTEVEALEEITDGGNVWVRVGQRQWCAKHYDGNVYLN